MDIRPLSPSYAVSPQIAAEDLPQIAAAGYGTIICNRPDQEVPSQDGSSEMEKAAAAAGIKFVYLPVTHETLNAQAINRQKEVMQAAEGPVLAYCASGTRSSIVWSFSQVGEMSADDIIAATKQAGYALDGLYPQLAELSGR